MVYICKLVLYQLYFEIRLFHHLVVGIMAAIQSSSECTLLYAVFCMIFVVKLNKYDSFQAI